MVFTKEVVRQYVGKWVRCHSVYGLHEGVVHRVLHDGIILVHTVHLANHDGEHDVNSFESGIFEPGSDRLDVDTVQFFPAPGLFVPYGGIYRIWPGFGFVI